MALRLEVSQLTVQFGTVEQLYLPSTPDISRFYADVYYARQ